MARACSPVLLVVTLALGMVLGVTLDRASRPVIAQATATPPTLATPSPVADHDDEAALYDELARQYEQFAHVNRTFELVARAVSPSVVHLVARKVGRRTGDDGQPRPRFEETGSGVIIRPDPATSQLYVLTNNHVVEGASVRQIDIVLHDGRVLRPEQVWSDSKADVAVLKLPETDPPPPAARLGDSDQARVGSWVLALGSPFGLTHSVSHGIISARGRHEPELYDEGVENQDFLQTDAAINPGNSGGPLVNLKGEVIGINQSIATNSGGSEGVGFSIPINLAKWSMMQLITTGRVSRGALGVDLEEVKPDRALALGLKLPRGAGVVGVHPALPADLAGIRKGDVILRFNDVEILDINHLINMVSMTPIGDVADVVVWREGTSLSLEVTVADRDTIPIPAALVPLPERSLPRPEAGGGPLRRPQRPGSATSSALGLELVTLDEALAHRLGLPESARGAAVLTVERDSPLADAVRPNDVIAAIDGRAILSARQAAELLNQSPGPRELRLRRPTDDGVRSFRIEVPEFVTPP